MLRPQRISSSTARLVAVTGYGQTDDIRRAHEAGCDAHLIKPVELHNLLQNLGD